MNLSNLSDWEMSALCFSLVVSILIVLCCLAYWKVRKEIKRNDLPPRLKKRQREWLDLTQFRNQDNNNLKGESRP